MNKQKSTNGSQTVKNKALASCDIMKIPHYLFFFLHYLIITLSHTL